MIRKLNFFLFLQLAVFGTLLASPQDSIKLKDYLKSEKVKTKTTTSGLHYKLLKKGKGDTPSKGQYVKIYYTGKMLNGEVFDAVDNGEPFLFRVDHRQVVPGLNEGVKLMKPGSQAKLFLPPTLGFGDYGFGKQLPPNASIIYEVQLLEILNEQQYEAYMRAFEARQRQAYERTITQQFIKDQSAIEAYLRGQNTAWKKTKSGLHYTLENEGTGNLAQAGNRVQGTYEVSLLDGTRVYSDDAPQAFDFTLGRRSAIEGLEEGLQFFREGALGQLIIPSKLAYGTRAISGEKVKIPENSVLVFKIKLEKLNGPKG